MQPVNLRDFLFRFERLQYPEPLAVSVVDAIGPRIQEVGSDVDAFFAGESLLTEAVADPELESYPNRATLLALAKGLVKSEVRTERPPANQGSVLFRMAAVLLCSQIAYWGLNNRPRIDYTSPKR
jgi:hypothetical protein